MLEMLRFYSSKPSLGIEFTNSSIRLAILSTNNKNLSVKLKERDFSAGLLKEDYSVINIKDEERLIDELKQSLTDIPGSPIRKAALSLPDSIFRIQTFEFDEFPSKPIDQERLVRWRLEKGSFDIADIVLQYQVLKSNEKGFSVIVCVAKQSVIRQYEAILTKLGLEPWCIRPSTFNILNLYQPYFSQSSSISILVHVVEHSCTTVISGNNEILYRYKDVKKGRADSITSKFVREIGDFVHYYLHRDPSCRPEISRIYLAGTGASCTELIEGIKEMTSLEVEIPLLSTVIPAADGAGVEMAAALGAGYSII